MPSLAETNAAQQRTRGRFMAMAAIIQTEQPDSLVLLPPGSAGETRAVGERWPARRVGERYTGGARADVLSRGCVLCRRRGRVYAPAGGARCDLCARHPPAAEWPRPPGTAAVYARRRI
jgi:hypothetical protein